MLFQQYLKPSEYLIQYTLLASLLVMVLNFCPNVLEKESKIAAKMATPAWRSRYSCAKVSRKNK